MKKKYGGVLSAMMYEWKTKSTTHRQQQPSEAVATIIKLITNHSQTKYIHDKEIHAHNRTHFDESVENERKTTKKKNNKISELWMCINLTHFSQSYYTLWALNERHKTIGWRIYNQFLFLIFFFTKKNHLFLCFGMLACYRKTNQKFFFSCLPLNFFSFASFQVHITQGS